MADSTASPFSLYRLTAAADTEASIADAEALGFDFGANEQTNVGIIGLRLGSHREGLTSQTLGSAPPQNQLHH